MRHLLIKDDQESEGLVFCFPSSSADRLWSAEAQTVRWTTLSPPRKVFTNCPVSRPDPLYTWLWKRAEVLPPSAAPVKPDLEEATPIFTVLAGVVHQDDLLQEDGRGGVQDAVHGPQQGAPGFIVKHDDHAGGWQGGAPLEGLLNTSVAKRVGRKSTKI